MGMDVCVCAAILAMGSCVWGCGLEAPSVAVVSPGNCAQAPANRTKLMRVQRAAILIMQKIPVAA